MFINNYIIYISLATKIGAIMCALIFFVTEKIACVVRIDSCVV